MNEERYLVVLGSGLAGLDLLLDHPGLSAPLDIGPPRIDITLRTPGERVLRILDTPLHKEPSCRDWEKRERKRRRK